MIYIEVLCVIVKVFIWVAAVKVPPHIVKWKSQRVSIWCSPPPPPLAFITALILLCMEFTSALIFLIGMFSHSSSNAVRNCPSVLGGSDVFLRACPVRPTNAQLGTNLDCTVASRVVQCCCLPESLGKLWLHEDGHYRAVKAFDAIALT